jgi:hypothetical protein
MISTPIGPTFVSMRSCPSSRDARTVYCVLPSMTIVANASMTPTFGYTPNATIITAPPSSVLAPK